MNEQSVGLALAVSSSVFIGSSFIIKKRGLRVAGASGLRAGAGGFSYLREPIWWAGLLSMVVGELANFAAYAFAPAVLVTPLGALSIIVSAVLAHIFLKEHLNLFGILGCILCITGSVTIVLHVPAERPIESVAQVWNLAMQPGFLLYSAVALGLIVWLIFWVSPVHGSDNVLVYLAICSLAGSFTVSCCKALGVALKLTFQGQNQLVYAQFYVFLAVVVVCLVTQMNYLNKSLDMFNTAIVSPIYYVMFTLLTITATVIMFQDDQTSRQLATQACGFITIVSGTFLLHATKDLDLTAVNLEHMLDRQNEAAVTAAGGAALSAGSMRERRPVASGLEMGGLDGGKGDAAEKGLANGSGQGKEGDDEHHSLLGSGQGGSGAARGQRKQRGLGTLL